MITNRDRILTTHVGSLPRNQKLSDLLIKQEAHEPYDQKEFDAEMDKAVRDVVERQQAVGASKAAADKRLARHCERSVRCPRLRRRRGHR